MNDPSLVGVGERVGYAQRHVDQRGKIHHPIGKPPLKGLAFEQFHRDEWWIDTNIVDGADVGVIQGRGRACFVLEAFERRR